MDANDYYGYGSTGTPQNTTPQTPFIPIVNRYATVQSSQDAAPISSGYPSLQPPYYASEPLHVSSLTSNFPLRQPELYETSPPERLVTVSPAEALPDPMEEFKRLQEEILREEKEREEKRERRKNELRQSLDMKREEMEADIRRQDEQLREQLREDERRAEREREESSRKWQEAQDSGRIEFEKGMELKRAEFAEEQREADARRAYEEEQAERVLREQNEQIRRAAEEHETVMRHMEVQRLREQTEHEATLRQIGEEYERAKMRFEKLAMERERQMKVQLEQLAKMLQYRVWNTIIEGNWSNRLAILRSANAQVAGRFETFISAARALDDCSSVDRQKELVQLRLTALLEALTSEKRLMELEAGNLQIMLDNTRKEFLVPILTSVLTILSVCQELKSSLIKYSQSLNFDPQEAANLVPRLAEHAQILARCVNQVPTIAELKMAHRFETSSGADGEHASQEVVPFQSVIIQEIQED